MSRLKTIIDANIKENGNQEITGKTMNYVLTEIANDVNTDGYFPNMSVGFADNLVGRGESVPAEFTFRATGGKSIKDGAARIKRIKGNSVVWNNMVDTRGYEAGFLIREGIKIRQGHRYLLQRSASNASMYFVPVVDGSESYDMMLRDGEYAKIFISQYTDTTDARVFAEGYCGACVITDLTQMFGAGDEPSTIEEYNARKPIVADEFAYNEGEVIHCNTESIKSVGDNAWDEQWELGIISNGENYELEGYIRSKNYIPIIGGEDYNYANRDNNERDYLNISFYDEHKVLIDSYSWSIGTFPTPINARYMRFYVNDTYGTTYKNDIMISLVHSGWKAEKDDQYQPYWQDTLPLPIIRKYFPQGMKSAGSAHDEIRYNKASGKWEAVQRIGSVDMSQFGWYQGSGFWASWNSMELMADMKKPSDNGEVANICCKKYVAGSWTSVYEATEGNIAMYSDDGRIGIADSSIQSDADIMAATQGIILYYELAEPIITEIDEPFGTDYRVADFGTEQAISNIPSAPFRADIIYQFNAVDMIRELWLKVQELESRVAQL